MERQKNYEELTIRDPFMFGKICSKSENRKLILDALLQIDLHEKTGEVEKYVSQYRDSKYTRLDLLVKDEDGAIYNAEMQNKSKNKSRQKELPQRGRYYQSIIDTTFFETGKDYLEMPETFIVFICTYDPFGLGLPYYRFETKCVNADNVPYDERACKIFFNTTADLTAVDIPESVKNMLKYIETGDTKDEATSTLDNEIKEALEKEEWKADYMLTVVHDRDLINEGIAQGRESCQPEIDQLKANNETLTAAIQAKDAEIERLKKLLGE